MHAYACIQKGCTNSGTCISIGALNFLIALESVKYVMHASIPVLLLTHEIVVVELELKNKINFDYTL